MHMSKVCMVHHNHTMPETFWYSNSYLIGNTLRLLYVSLVSRLPCALYAHYPESPIFWYTTLLSNILQYPIPYITFNWLRLNGLAVENDGICKDGTRNILTASDTESRCFLHKNTLP